ncbi:mitochondrial potassium channel-like [Haliotis asinina]|uniref:mitochondrial potassium channel-like n=1 Tax=Haliotis asinina TaxID=109174 RepID=UPI00353277FC
MDRLSASSRLFTVGRFCLWQPSFYMRKHRIQTGALGSGNGNGQTKVEGLINSWMQKYEEFVGLTLVKEAQNNVLQRETKFLLSQEERRAKQQELGTIQSRLKTVSAELDKTNKSDDRYLDIVKMEHSIIREEHQMVEDIRNLEKQEREYFSLLSAAVRESHEKERAQAEKTKYWSIIGSIIGAIIGITGSTVNNYLRMREMKGIVHTSVSSNEELKDLSLQLCSAIRTQFDTFDSFLADLKSAIDKKGASTVRASLPAPVANKHTLHEQTDKILETLVKQELFLNAEIKDIKKILGLTRKDEEGASVVYVGPEVKTLLQTTEDNLEWKMKMNSLATATFIYGALALTIPIILSFFKGS